MKSLYYERQCDHKTLFKSRVNLKKFFENFGTNLLKFAQILRKKFIIDV